MSKICCGYDLGDDFDRCKLLIDEYEELITEEQTMDKDDKKYENLALEKDILKRKIKDKLELINSNADGLAQIDRLQKLNEKYQILLAEESKIKA